MKFHGDKTLILTVVVATGSFLLAACSDCDPPAFLTGGDPHVSLSHI